MARSVCPRNATGETHQRSTSAGETQAVAA